MAAASTSKAASGSKRKASVPGSAASTAVSKSKKVKSSSSSAEDASIPLGKALASTEKRTRDAAVRSLTAYLSANGAQTIPELELQKLWKGLFYCFWMSDKPLIQQRLANDLAQLVLVHPTSAPSERATAGLKFLEAFWDTIVAEWSGLDKHRIDKFYLLVRRFVAAGFRLLAEEKWPTAGAKEFQRILGKFDGGVLSTNNPKVPDSLTYHLSDLYLDELEKVMQQLHDEEQPQEQEDDEEEAELPLVPTLELLMPFVDALATAKSKAMYDRIWSNVFQPLLDDTLVASARDDDGFSDDEDEQASEAEDDDEEDSEQGDEDDAADATTATEATEFHSFADESSLSQDDESEPSLAPSSSSSSSDDSDDVRYPLLLALSSVSLPATTDEDVDVALLLRKDIFKALFTAASRKDATEARRRLLYQLWRDEQDRLNDANDDSSDDDEEE